MKRYILLTVIFPSLFAMFTTVNAQEGNIIKSLEKVEPGQGQVRIFQDPEIEKLLGTEQNFVGSENQGSYKTSGYRIQVYAGSNSGESKREAVRMASKVREYFPELKVYTTFASPRWICRVGDFRSIEEADRVMRQLRRISIFKEVSIVKEQVIITY